MTTFRLALTCLTCGRLHRSILAPVFLALAWCGLLWLALAEVPSAHASEETLVVAASVTNSSYPTVSVTVTNIVSGEVSQALHEGNFGVCETPIQANGPRHCQSNLTATAVTATTPYRLLVVLDKSLPAWNQPSWAAVTQSVHSLIEALGPQDQISILPFSHADTIESPGDEPKYSGSQWMSDTTAALAYLNNIQVDASWTALNKALDNALVETMRYPKQKIRIVVIADRLDNTRLGDKMVKELHGLLQRAQEIRVPIDIYCYGPPIPNPSLSVRDLSAWVAATGSSEEKAKLEIFPSATELEERLARVRNLLNRYPRAFTFHYHTKFPADNGTYQLEITKNVTQSVGSTQFTLPSLPMDAPLLYLQDPQSPTSASFPLTNSYQVQWTGVNPYKVAISTAVTTTWPVSIAHVLYELTLNEKLDTYGPYPDPAEQIHLAFALPAAINKPQATIKTIVTDKNGNTGSSSATLTFAPPPVFAFELTSPITRVAAITDFRSSIIGVVPLTVTLINQSGLSQQDLVTITNAASVFVANLPIGTVTPITQSQSITTYGVAGFWPDLGQFLAVNGRFLLYPQANLAPAYTHMLKACLVKADAICQQAQYTLQPLTIRDHWNKFVAAWWRLLLLWLLLFCAGWALFILVVRMARHTSIEIPIKIHNRGGLALPCYLQAQAPDAPDVRPVLLASGQKTAPPLPTQPPSNALITAARTTPAPVLSDQRWARRLQLSQRRVSALRHGWQRFLGVLRLRWLVERISSFGSPLRRVGALLSGATPQPDTAFELLHSTQATWQELPVIPPNTSSEARLLVESLARRQRTIRVIVRVSPDRITDTCEYELEIRLGGVWWRPTFTQIKPKPL